MFLAISADAFISVTRNNGFDGVSMYNILVSGLMYFSTFSICVVSTKSTSTNRVNTLLMHDMFLHRHQSLKLNDHLYLATL